ncbi:hypothetical protein T492DRAFT_1017331 [Pavlovales sp. CCMP2436]|nr:hypothetical protein T492DRAFT_1017331 [Pavlovales sp. CCMP2436]
MAFASQTQALDADADPADDGPHDDDGDDRDRPALVSDTQSALGRRSSARCRASSCGVVAVKNLLMSAVAPALAEAEAAAPTLAEAAVAVAEMVEALPQAGAWALALTQAAMAGWQAAWATAGWLADWAKNDYERHPPSDTCTKRCYKRHYSAESARYLPEWRARMAGRAWPHVLHG